MSGLAATLTLENYTRAWSLAPFGPYYINTVSSSSMILAVQFVTITLAGFAFAHYRFSGKRGFFFFILLQMMIPTTALLVPNFATIRHWVLFDTRLAIAIPYFGSAFGTFLMRQAFLEVPRDLVDAGIIDGCSWWQLSGISTCPHRANADRLWAVFGDLALERIPVAA